MTQTQAQTELDLSAFEDELSKVEEQEIVKFQEKAVKSRTPGDPEGRKMGVPPLAEMKVGQCYEIMAPYHHFAKVIQKHPAGTSVAVDCYIVQTQAQIQDHGGYVEYEELNTWKEVWAWREWTDYDDASKQEGKRRERKATCIVQEKGRGAREIKQTPLADQPIRVLPMTEKKYEKGMQINDSTRGSKDKETGKAVGKGKGKGKKPVSQN